MKLPRCRVLAGLACAVALAAAQANPPEIRTSARTYNLPPLRLSAQTDLVELDVVVRRPDGALLAGLERGNFAIFDNGQPRPIAAFAVATAAPPPATAYSKVAPKTAVVAAPPPAAAPPRSVALFFDDINTSQTDLGNARNAALRFVQEALAPGDRVAVFTASAEQTLDFTHNRARLLAGIAAIRAHPRASDTQLPCPRITAYTAFLITVQHDPGAFDAVNDEAKLCAGSAPPTDEFNGRPIAGLGLNAEANSETVLAQAQSTWEQAEGISLDTLDAVRGVVGYLARQPGSRMLLLASGGFLSGSMALDQAQDTLTQEALHGNVVINALDAKGLFTDGPGRPINELLDVPELPMATFFFEESSKFSMRQAQDDAMVHLAQSTGGLFFHDNNDLTLGFYRLGMIPEVTYQLAFSPGNIPHDGKYHKLAVKLTPAKRSAGLGPRGPKAGVSKSGTPAAGGQGPAPTLGHDIVQARPGYFAPPPATDPAALQLAMDDAMHDQTEHGTVPATVLVEPGRGRATVHVRLEAGRLPFVQAQGRHRLDLRFMAGLFDAQGHWVAGKEGEMDLALKDATWHRLASQGLSANLTLAAPKGDYRLRVVVGDSGDGQLFATDQAVSVQ